jgi:hypothetical protein
LAQTFFLVIANDGHSQETGIALVEVESFDAVRRSRGRIRLGGGEISEYVSGKTSTRSCAAGPTTGDWRKPASCPIQRARSDSPRRRARSAAPYLHPLALFPAAQQIVPMLTETAIAQNVVRGGNRVGKVHRHTGRAGADQRRDDWSGRSRSKALPSPDRDSPAERCIYRRRHY